MPRAEIEMQLRLRKLDHTLTTALPEPATAHAVAACGFAALDARLGGGFPRGALSEIVGPRSSGRTSLLCAALAAATRRGELAVLIDTRDTFDPGSSARTGLDFARLLWIRGDGGPDLDRALQRAIKALTLVLQMAEFGLVTLDLADVPAHVLGRLPFTTWMRLQRMVGARTACVLIGGEPIARSAAGITLALQAPGGCAQWAGGTDRSRLLSGLETQARIVRARLRPADHRPLAVRLGLS